MNKMKEQLDRIEKLIGNQNEKPLNFIQAAKYIDVSKSYLYKLTSGGEISHFKPHGKRIYFKKEDLDNWVFKNRIKSNEEIQEEADKFLNTD